MSQGHLLNRSQLNTHGSIGFLLCDHPDILGLCQSSPYKCSDGGASDDRENATPELALFSSCHLLQPEGCYSPFWLESDLDTA